MPREDINKLLAASWPKLSDSAVKEMVAALRAIRVPQTPPGRGQPRPALTLRVDNVSVRWLSTDFGQPRHAPGYTRFSSNELEFALPIADEGWFLEARMRLRGEVRLRGVPLGFNVEQTIQFSDLRFVVRLPLRDGNSDRPRLHDPVFFLPRFRLTFVGLLNFETDTVRPCASGDGYCYELQADKTRPPDPPAYQFEGTIRVRVSDKIELDLNGFLFDDGGPIPFQFPYEMPLPAALADALTGIPKGRLPRVWGENNPQPAPPPPPGFGFRALATELETRFEHHAPPLPGASKNALGVVQDNHYDEFQPCLPGQAPVAYSGAGDTAIWTGHLLAAEALRWASAPNDAERRRARDQALWVLNGISKLFAVTGVPGLLCRAALPRFLADQTEDFRHREPAFKDDYYQTTLGGVPWIGKGRAISPPTRDSHVGILLGFAFAYHFVADATVREQVRQHTTALLDFLLKNGWNVPTPPSGRIITTFFHQFHQQLALLRLGATVDPTRFAAKYREAARAADASWLPVWGGSLDPIHKYYKFNLGHATLAVLLTLEDDPALRVHYERALRVLRRATGHHRNAWFNLVWLLADPAHAGKQAEGSVPGVSVREETRSLLFGWAERRETVNGPNCLPRKQTPDPAGLEALYEADPSRIVPYTPVGTSAPLPFRVATFALDVGLRPGRGRDFLWQRDPFDAGIIVESGNRPVVDGGEPTIEAPGVDYLLPCYLADYLNVV